MSCDIDDSVPYPDVVNEKIRRARCDHYCDACKEKIRRGDRYFYSFWVDEYGKCQIKRCLRCEKIYRHLCRVAPADTAPDGELDCGHTYEDVHGCEPPPEIAALAFALPGEVEL